MTFSIIVNISKKVCFIMAYQLMVSKSEILQQLPHASEIELNQPSSIPYTDMYSD